MDGPGDSADPDGGVAPPAAFFGLWPKFAEQEIADAAAVRIASMPQPVGGAGKGG